MADKGKRSDQPSSLPNRRGLHRRKDDRKLLQHGRELEAARRLSQAFFQCRRLEDLIENVLQTALEVVGAEAGSVLLADYENERLVFRYVIGEKAQFLHGVSFPWNEGIAGAVFQSGEPAVIADVKKDPRHFTGVDLVTGYRTRDMITLPLKQMIDYRTRDMITLPLKQWEGDPVGVVNVLNKRNGVLNEDDLGLLTIIATFAAMAIQQARLFEDVKLAEVARLVADIGHDLRNLHQPVISGTELLQEELADVFAHLPQIDVTRARSSQKLCEGVIEMVQTTSRRIQVRLKQIGDCVKGLSAPPKFAPCNLPNLVEEVFKTLRTFAGEKQVSLRIEGLHLLPPIMADEQRLFNAFYNLVSNAIPEVPEKGSVTVRGEMESADWVLLTVVDTGRGMPPEIRDSLFTARALSTKKGGTGLGTKIVKDAVDAHKGKITVESQEGVGTTFSLTLPLDPARIPTP
ncbi:MAG: ATP-binding protein [Nitrospiraceae bacterium]